MLTRRHARGVTLVELIIGIVIFGVLMALGLPSITGYLQNGRVRALASSFLNGAQQARTEAIKNNAAVDFVVTDGAIAVDATPNANGHNWVVRGVLPLATDPTLISGKSASEGQGAGVTVVGNVGVLSFNGLGGAGAAGMGPYTFNFTLPSSGACAPSGPIRCLRMVVSAGGQARLCDPAAASGDTRAC